jgi:glutaredoxin 3
VAMVVAHIELYTTAWCPYCERAKSLLKSKGQQWTEVNIEETPGAREEMVARSGRMTVPQIFIAGTPIGGFDDLSALERAGELDSLLSA